MKKYYSSSVCVTSLLFMLAAMPAIAQEQDSTVLEEIIVTSQFREAGLQDVPISVAAVDADLITKTNIVKIEDLTTLVPNFTYSETGIATNFFIRGVGSGINQGFEQSVGVYVDGVHFPRAQQVRAPFLDLERVEVLRGPQSILFGKNSVAGAMNITTAKPTDHFEGSLLGSYEIENNESIVEGVLSGPLSDKVRVRVAGRYRDLGGWIENITLNRDEPGREEVTLRGTIEADISENLLATFKAEHSQFDTTGRNIEVENVQAVDGATYGQVLAGVFGADLSVLNETQDGRRSSNGDFSDNEMSVYQLTLDWNLGGFDIQSISAYEKLEYQELCDCDFTGAFVFDAALQEDYTQFSQEIRLTSPEHERLNYILGVYYQTFDHDFQDQIRVPANSVLVPALGASGSLLAGTEAARTANVEGTVLSAFAQANWTFSEAFELQLGGRITKDERDGSRFMVIRGIDNTPLPEAQAGAAIVYAGGFSIASNNLDAFAAAGEPTATALQGRLGVGAVAGDREKTTFSPDVKLVWDVNDDVMLYTSWAKGFKSGAFDFRANNRGASATGNDAFEFEDEQATNYELGGKFKLSNSAELNVTAYFTQFEDLQISIFDGTLGFNVGNAAEAEIMGLELDGRWAISDNVRLTGGLSFIDFEFTDFKNGQCYFGATPDVVAPGETDARFCDYTGNSNQLVSDVSGNLSLDFNYPIGSHYELTGLANIFYASEYDAAATFDPAGIQEAYSKINMRLGIGPNNGHWEVALLGKNLTDEIIRTFNGDVPLAGSSFGRKANYTFYSPGRTIALQARFKF